MRTLLKRGVQTAVVTGGLLALGTGVAAAQGVPASPEQAPNAVDQVVQSPAQSQQGVLASGDVRGSDAGHGKHRRSDDSDGLGGLGELGNLANFGDPGNVGNLSLIEGLADGNVLDEALSEFGAAGGDLFGLDHFAGVGDGGAGALPGSQG
jgi:hypothetical protein